MSSFRQIEANRRNARLSKGPVTEEGKRKSRQNAVRHGLTAETVITDWPKIGSASTERPWRSCVSPQSASCSENSAIRPEVSG